MINKANNFKQLALRFSQPLLNWYDEQGRKDLPWQHPKDAYRIWISEIMLQQTQVQTVIPYFQRFMEHFPDINTLAEAPEDEVLALWSGLGYYSRARNLHKTAQIIQHQYQGLMPCDLELLNSLPGIGPSTAAAILSQAFNKPTAILDGNVKRVLARFFLIKGQTEQTQVKKTLWELAQKCMPQKRCAEYTQAIMDLGALCCTRQKPNCTYCPVQQNCLAFETGEQLLYPEKKIKKPVPLYHQQFLVLLNDEQKIYLERRPPSGVWGGLWCLPSIDEGLCPLQFIKDSHNLTGLSAQELIQFKHRFTHFHLQIRALSIQTKPLGPQLQEPRGQWLRLDECKNLGLAKPTSLILEKVAK